MIKMLVTILLGITISSCAGPSGGVKKDLKATVQITCKNSEISKSKAENLLQLRNEIVQWKFLPYRTNCYLFGGAPKPGNTEVEIDDITFISEDFFRLNDQRCTCKDGIYSLMDGSIQNAPKEDN